MQWLEQDEVRDDALDGWAREDGEPLDGGRIVAGGVVLDRGGKWSAIPWDRILGVAYADQGYLLVPRRPPAPPWCALPQRVTARIEASLAARQRARSEGYRGARPGRPAPPPPEQILRRVLARDDVPGAIEVPLGIPRPTLGAPTAIGGATAATLGVQLLEHGLTVASVAGLSGGLLFGGAIHFGMWRRYAKRPRILVMTPDAYVAGLDGGAVRAIPWDRVEAFREGSVGGRPAIEVVDREGRLLARTEARLFGIDRGVLVALAEAYRRRALDDGRT